MQVYGHVHDYERYAPTFNLSVRAGRGSAFHQYLNPRATVHVTSGAGEALGGPPGATAYQGWWDMC